MVSIMWSESSTLSALYSMTCRNLKKSLRAYTSFLEVKLTTSFLSRFGAN
jgi:hypothetical protein